MTRRICSLVLKAHPEASCRLRELTAVTQFARALRDRHTSCVVGVLGHSNRERAVRLAVSASVCGLDREHRFKDEGAEKVESGRSATDTEGSGRDSTR